MKEVTVSIPDDKEIKYKDGVLSLVDAPLKQTHKFKLGDKATLNKSTAFASDGNKCKCIALLEAGAEVEIFGIIASYPNCLYRVKYEQLEAVVESDEITLIPISSQSITERIKTFEDAIEWCRVNGHDNLLDAWKNFDYDGMKDDDVLAYLKLRIITAALNEGWEPTIERGRYRYYPSSSIDKDPIISFEDGCRLYYPFNLLLKSATLATYAATQFRDIYMDFFYKGKE